VLIINGWLWNKRAHFCGRKKGMKIGMTNKRRDKVVTNVSGKINQL
jgi:hypothetical protein